ncbi:helix-turn-helix domain-containing protein [Xanthobacter sp. V3C-3]|uniref:helix-turn-helix domain-containing protein n=1 Tax=Xanthobacter lutulentifluminis TaxID=3119935 RepID=UPI00372AD62A
MNTAPAVRLVSLPDAQVMLGLSRASLYRLLSTGSLRAKKIGRRTLVETGEIERFIKAAPAARIAPPNA